MAAINVSARKKEVMMDFMGLVPCQIVILLVPILGDREDRLTGELEL